MKIKQLFNNRAWLLMTLLVLGALNWAASAWHSRIDFTGEKRFTLSSHTEENAAEY